jgi:seryl-tRNA synthetase
VTATAALLPTGTTGVYLSTGEFETIVRALVVALGAFAGTMPELYTPPVIARELIEKVGYHEAFPHLLGHVVTRPGGAAGGEGDLVLLPAGCYCVYPAHAGTRLGVPLELSVEATCFRAESTNELGRLRSFRMREFVRLDTAQGCLTWRDERLAAARDWLATLGLATISEIASDPFFGTGGRMLRLLQVERELKIELTAQLGAGQTQAVASANYHTDKFGQLFAITGPDGDVAHTACLAFGYERLALALMHRHGADTTGWPADIQRTLGLVAAP